MNSQVNDDPVIQEEHQRLKKYWRDNKDSIKQKLNAAIAKREAALQHARRPLKEPEHKKNSDLCQPPQSPSPNPIRFAIASWLGVTVFSFGFAMFVALGGDVLHNQTSRQIERHQQHTASLCGNLTKFCGQSTGSMYNQVRMPTGTYMYRVTHFEDEEAEQKCNEHWDLQEQKCETCFVANSNLQKLMKNRNYRHGLAWGYNDSPFPSGAIFAVQYLFFGIVMILVLHNLKPPKDEQAHTALYNLLCVVCRVATAPLQPFFVLMWVVQNPLLAVIIICQTCLVIFVVPLFFYALLGPTVWPLFVNVLSFVQILFSSLFTAYGSFVEFFVGVNPCQWYEPPVLPPWQGPPLQGEFSSDVQVYRQGNVYSVHPSLCISKDAPPSQAMVMVKQGAVLVQESVELLRENNQLFWEQAFTVTGDMWVGLNAGLQYQAAPLLRLVEARGVGLQIAGPVSTDRDQESDEGSNTFNADSKNRAVFQARGFMSKVVSLATFAGIQMAATLTVLQSMFKY